MTMYRALLAMFVVGVTLFLALASRPHFRDAADWPWVPYVDDPNSPAFLEARERNRTVEGRLADAGLGIAVLALSLAVGAVALNAGHAGRPVVTPSRKLVIVVLANVSLLAVYVGEYAALARDQVRGEFPPWADSMGIPMAALVSGWQRAATILTVLLMVCLPNAHLPTSLWRRPVGPWPWITTTIIGCVVTFGLLVLTEAVEYGKALAIPGYVALLYCLLCARAAAASAPDVRAID